MVRHPAISSAEAVQHCLVKRQETGFHFSSDFAFHVHCSSDSDVLHGHGSIHLNRCCDVSVDRYRTINGLQPDGSSDHTGVSTLIIPDTGSCCSLRMVTLASITSLSTCKPPSIRIGPDRNRFTQHFQQHGWIGPGWKSQRPLASGMPRAVLDVWKA